LAIIFSIFFLKLKIKANTVTLINIIFSLYILIYIFNHQTVNFAYLIFLYFIRILIDHTDGTIARVNDKKTFFGRN
jgi:phosphatidylserine synthase